MTSLIALFRSEFISGAFSLMGKTWLKYIVLYLIQLVISLIGMIPLFLSVINYGFIEELVENPDMLENNPEMILQFFSADISTMIVAGVLFFILILLLASWQMNASLKLNEAVILEQPSDIGTILGKSFDSVLPRLLGAYLVIMVVYLVFIGLAVAIGYYASIALGVFSGFAGMVFMIRFSLIPACIVHGKMSIGEAISHGLSLITTRRMFIILLAGILFIAMLFIASLLISLISFVFLLIPFLGLLIQMAVQLAFSGVINSLTIGAISGLYYRWNEPPAAEDDISSHLVQVT